MSQKLIRRTFSLCPVCNEKVPAEYVRDGGHIRLLKRCPKHGDTAPVVWRGEPDFEQWCCGWEGNTEANLECPTKCGLCAGHVNDTCCTILDVTQRCNLNCNICFANAGSAVSDIPLADVYHALDDIYEKGRYFLHISGGEPTIRDDIVDIVAYASKRGFEYIQINTNGLSLASDPCFAKELSTAGASCVFLQFDGTNDDIYTALRGKPLLSHKLKAIENCDAAEIGVVLVPTLIPGINDDDVGNIIRFALDNVSAIKGVHFQPAAYTGRFTKGERLTLPELLRAIDTQTDGLIKQEYIAASTCDAPLCGFHAEFRKTSEKLTALSSRVSCCCGAPDVSVNQNHVKSRWTRKKSGNYVPGSLDAFLKQVKDTSFCISAMFFQDADTFDVSRVMQCSVHVYSEGCFVPLCVYNNLRR